MKRFFALLLVLIPLTLRAEPLSPPVLERYEKMLAAAPETGPAFDKVYQHFLETEGLDALATRWRANADKGDRAAWWIALGLLEDRRGRGEAARKYFLEAAEQNGGWRASAALAAAEARAGRLSDAAAAYQKALSGNPPDDAKAALFRGLALSRQRQMDFAGALAAWQEYARAFPNDPFVLEEAGDALLEAGRYDEAQEMYDRLRQSAANDPARKLQAGLRLAEVERLRGKKSEALRLYSEALAEAGEASWLQREVRARIEAIFRRDDDLPGLADYYQKRLTETPGDLDAAIALSGVLEELSRTKEAVTVLREASGKAPDRRDLALRLATLLLKTEKPAEAGEVLAALEKRQPNDPEVLTRQGEAQWMSFKLGKGSKDAAVQTWAKLAPEGADANTVQALAEIYRSRELTGEALQAYRRALDLDPAAADRRERLADFLLTLDRREEAEAVLAGMVEGDRANGENFLRLAKIQRRMGNTAAARQSLAAAKALPERAFDRTYLEWQIVSEADQWEEAAALADTLRTLATTEPEAERADTCLVEALIGGQKAAGRIRVLLDRGPEKLSEADWRLLYLLAVESDDRGSASYAATEGLARFPQSAPLAKLELAEARRVDDMARRLAAFERLEKLEPQRAGEWMADRARLLREGERWDEAIALARQIVTASPARPEPHLLLADLFLAQEKPDEAISALRQAIAISDTPNTIRFRLADLYAGRGETTEARAVLDEAFEAEETPAGKLQLTGRLAAAYLQDGKVDELIARFRARQKAEEGGWRYALYLAEVFSAMQDPVRVQDELDKALIGKPDDPILLKRLKTLAETNSDPVSVLRYARKIAEIEPSASHRAQLAAALAQAGQTEDAIGVIRDNTREFFEDPSLWQDAVRSLQAADRGKELAAMLEANLRAHPGDWRSMLILAEIAMGLGDESRANALLWQILALPEETNEPPANPAPTPAAGARPFTGMAPGRAPVANSRGSRFYEVFQRASQMLSGDRSNSSSPRIIRRTILGTVTPGPADASAALRQAKDDAIIYLACLAVRSGKEDEYLEKLSAQLQDLPLSDRLEIYGMLQAPEAILRSVRAALEQPEIQPNEVTLAIGALQTIAANQRNRGSNLIAPDELTALIDQLTAKLPQDALPQTVYQRFYLLNALGRTEEAEKLADEFLANLDESDATQLAIGFNLALNRRDLDRALALREKQRALQTGANAGAFGFQNFSLAMQLMQSETHRAKGFDLMVDEIRSPAAGMRFGGISRQSVFWPQLRGRGLGSLMPFPTSALDAPKANMVRSLGQGNPAMRKVLPEFAKHVARQAGDSETLKEMVVWLEWFGGRQKEALAAMKALVEAAPSNERAINYALLLADSGDSAGALTVLDGIRGTAGDAPGLAARLRLALALQGKDQAVQVDAARRLLAFRLDPYEQSELVNELKRLSLTEEAERLQAQPRSTRTASGRARPLNDVLRERMEKGSPDEAVAVAEAILSRDPLATTSRSDRQPFDQAFRTLQKHHRYDAFLDDLRAQLAEAPDSARLNALMATALASKDPKAAEPYLRKLVELRPNDAAWLHELGNLLVRNEQFDAAMDVYERLLAQDPSVLYAQGTNFVEPYRRSKSWPRLSEAVRKSPDPRPDPLQPHRQNYSHIFVQLGREMQRARPSADPTDVWLKGLRWDAGNSAQLRPMLAQSLLRAGRKDEARTVIEEAFFPPGVEQSTARVFVFNRQFQTNSLWSQWQSYGNGDFESLALRLMRLAHDQGFLQELLPRLAKVGTTPDGMNPELMARVVLQDETVLADLKKLLAADEKAPVTPGLRSNANPMMLRALASELARWPAGTQSAIECLTAAVRIMQLNGPDYSGILSAQMQLADLAAELGQTERARKALADWMTARTEWQRQGASVDFSMGLSVLRRMVSLGMTREATELLESFKSDRNVVRNDYYQRQIREFEAENALTAGAEVEVVPVLGWTPTGENSGTLLWDLRPAGAGSEDERTVWVSSQPMKRLDGKYTLDVYFGSNESAMKRIFSKPAAAARGTWQGDLPAGRGVMRAVLRKGESFGLGPAVTVGSGKVLVTPAAIREVPKSKGGTAPGWSGTPPTMVTLEKGGPGLTGEYLRLDGDRSVEMELTAERVPVDPKKSYLLSGWFRYPQNAGSARVGWRIYNAKGEEINSYSANGNFQPGRWNYATQSFGRGQNAYSMPERAAWIEPYIEFSGSCDFQGFSVTELALPAEP